MRATQMLADGRTDRPNRHDRRPYALFMTMGSHGIATNDQRMILVDNGLRNSLLNVLRSTPMSVVYSGCLIRLRYKRKIRRCICV